jgi:hypothetical protein
MTFKCNFHDNSNSLRLSAGAVEPFLSGLPGSVFETGNPDIIKKN